MILERDEIREIRKGEPVAVAVKRSLVVDSLHAVQAAVGKRSTLTVRVLDVWAHASGSGFVASVQLAAREIPTRYLRRGGGFTTEPGHAVSDPETGQKEWAPPADWVDAGAEVREDYRRKLEADMITRRLPEVDNWDDLVRIKQLARARGVDISSDLRVIEARIEAIGRKLRREAA